ncbi:uncharacterized protein LOC126661846 [Mercurialis annua]|uniref:uncharacterized protein LOC126661846 n=1 Tax=Mercurialis annua TaxID=3986 RepID=UPI002160BD9B|nr:uncharacterized protein LOC126661846 [Mercurialis annua]
MEERHDGLSFINGGEEGHLLSLVADGVEAIGDSNSYGRKNTKTKACKCTFTIMVRLFLAAWMVVAKSEITSMHNHDLVVYPEGHRQTIGLSLTSKQIEKNPYDYLTRRQVYNYRDNLRWSGFKGRDVVGQFYHMALEGHYVHWTLADPETSALTHIFMAHPYSVRLLQDYRWVIGMDSAYKINK